MIQGVISRRFGWALALAVAVVAALVLWVPAAFATPDEPAGLTATSLDQRVVLSWTNPGDNLIVGYQYRVGVSTDTGIDWNAAVDVQSGGDIGWQTVSGSYSGTTNVSVTRQTSFESDGSVSVDGHVTLVNGNEYVFEVRGQYADGADTDTNPDPGPAASVTATAGNPLANFRAEPASKSVTLRWDNPGDSAITGYQYRYRDLGADGTAGTPADDAVYLPGAETTDIEDSWTDIPGSDASTTMHTVPGTGVTWLDGAEFEFEVRAVGTGDGRDSEILATVGKPLTGFTATAFGNKVTLAWNYPGPNTDIASYEFRFSGNKGVDWTVDNEGSGGWKPANEANVDGVTGVSVDLATGSSNSGSLTRFDVKGLVIGKEYVFQIRARGTTTPAVATTFGASDQATVQPGSGLAGFAAMPGDESVIISWSNPGDAGISRYAYGVTDNANTPPTTWAPLAGTSSQTTNYKVASAVDPNGLVNGEDRTIWVRTEVRDGTSYTAQGREAKATFVVGMPLTGLTATPGDTRVTLSWNSPTYPAGATALITGYQYRQSTDGGKTWISDPAGARTDDTDPDAGNLQWETLATGATVSAVVTDLSNGTAYTFQIRAAPAAGDDDHGFGASNMETVAAGVASSVPVITGISPVGPANNNMPYVNGVHAGDRATVSVYTSAMCDGTAVATGRADRNGNFSIMVEVDDNSSTTFYAASTPRFGGNMSACSPAAAGATYVEDSAGPAATIIGGPATDMPTAVTDATFFLTADEVGSTFECSLDGAAFAACDVPVVSYTDLAPGEHTFMAQATDAAGNTGEAVSVTWTIVSEVSENIAGCTIVGTEGDDILLGTDGDDVICGLGGNDMIRGGAGNDELRGGKGDDTLLGGAGNDVISGGGGNDVIRGGKGDDVLKGRAGNDMIYGERGADWIYGGPGIDSAKVGDKDRARSIENHL